MNNTFKSIGAILAGMMVIVILSIATDTLLETLGIFPSRDIPYPSWMWGLALLYRTAYAVFGGFITAAAAPSKPMRHAIILGIIGLCSARQAPLPTWVNQTTGILSHLS